MNLTISRLKNITTWKSKLLKATVFSNLDSVVCLGLKVFMLKFRSYLKMSSGFRGSLVVSLPFVKTCYENGKMWLS